jgi:hypothetical protein
MVNVVGANEIYHQPNFAEHEFINGNIVDVARVVSTSGPVFGHLGELNSQVFSS